MLSVRWRWVQPYAAHDGIIDEEVHEMFCVDQYGRQQPIGGFSLMTSCWLLPFNLLDGDALSSSISTHPYGIIMLNKADAQVVFLHFLILKEVVKYIYW